MGKHTQNCTLIGKGVYGTIGVDQRSRLADGAHFHTMIVTSTLEASVIEGDKLVIKSGIVRCDGDIRVSSISGSGDIEVGRAGLGKNGIVEDPALRERALHDVVACAEQHGLDVVATADSPIIGTHGNEEYLLYAVLR